MQEQTKEIFIKSALFEATGQKITVTVSFENCTKKDCVKLKSVLKNLCEDITATVENSLLQTD